MHTDRGSQYASAPHRRLIKDYLMVQSMSRRGDCWDNAAMESFFKTLKVERVYRTRYETRAQAKLDIVDWIEGFYNRQRIHSSIGYKTPVGAECRRMSAKNGVRQINEGQRQPKSNFHFRISDLRFAIVHFH